MALAETETWQGGFIRDDSGNLVVTTDPAEEVFGTVVPGFLTDGDGRLVATYEPDEDTRTVVPGFVTDTSGRLAIASEVADPVYTVVPGFATDSSGYLSTQEGPASGTYKGGFVRDTDGALGVGATYVASPYEEAVLALTPAIFLPLDAVNGLTDISGNGRDGTAAGGLVVGGATGPLNVGDSGATNFTGAAGQKVTTTYSPYTADGANTIMGWAWRDVSTTYHYLFGSTADSKPGLRINTGGQQGYFNSNGTVHNWTPMWPDNGEWVHWAIVYDSPNDNLQAYINGSVISGGSASYIYGWATGGDLVVGGRNDTGLVWDGRMAWFSYHLDALTAPQIAACYAAGSA